MKPDQPILKTERLYLRPLSERDAGDMFVAFSDRAVCRYWSEPHHESPDTTLRMIQRSIANTSSEVFVISRGADQPALGWIYLGDRKANIAELGYIIRRTMWGKGLVVEAARAVIKHAFTTREVRRLYIDTDPDNAASIKVAEKLGFHFEGRARATWQTHMGVRDSLIFSRLVDDPDPFATIDPDSTAETGAGT